MIIIVGVIILNSTGTDISLKFLKNRNSSDDKVIEFLNDYYSSLGRTDFKVRYYYAPVVRKYFLQSNLSANEVSNLYYNNYLPENKNPVYTIDPNSIQINQSGNETVVRYTGTYTCYRVSKRKYLLAKNRVVLKLNNDMKIIEIYEEDIWNVKFTEHPIQ